MPLSLALRTRVSLRVLAHLRETEQEAPARDGQPERYLRHCLFSLGRNPAQQHSINKEATEELDCRLASSRCNPIADAGKHQPAQGDRPVYTRAQGQYATE